MVHVDISGYVEHLRADLAAAAAAGGASMVDAAERLATSLDAAVRLALLEALSDAAAEITAGLEGASVEVRLRGRDPDLVVTVHEPVPVPDHPPTEGPAPDPGPSGADDDTDDGAVARITLRLPEALKGRAEASAATQRRSLNTWLVEAVRAAADHEPSIPPPPGRGGAKHLSGWAR